VTQPPESFHCTAPAAEPAAKPVMPRSVFLKETACLMAVAIAGVALELPLGLGLKAIFHFEAGRQLWQFGAFAALTCTVPLAVKLNPKLGLPGAPLISAKFAGLPAPWRFRGLIRIAFVYALAAAGIGGGVLAILVMAGAFHMPVGSHGAFPIADGAKMAGRLAVLGTIAAIGAGLSEEILFRLCLFTILAVLLRPIMHDRAGRPSRAALWCATIVQGYLFGLTHLIAGAPALLKMKMAMLIVAVALPQTWQGIVFGRLYLKRGLEAAMIAHTIMDVGLLLFAAASLHIMGH
jgi:membrane protease YdiL (CAAX protease family)